MVRAYTVVQLTNYIKNMFSQDFVLQAVKVSGEISNCKYHTSGHIYFTLKDQGASIACIMFASDARTLKFKLENGLQVELEGRVDVYERDGKYQLYVKRVKQSGEGILYERFLALKAELEERGMFAPEYKRPIPKFVKRLGVVTASTGAAIQDITQIAKRRNPNIQIVLYPALVQGEGAAASIVRGIEELQNKDVDVIIVGRGGGSIEDLWAFNEEIVAEAIFNSEVPIISAVGHETDFTIADFVADLRASTPSAAAELAVYEKWRIDDQLANYKLMLDDAMYMRIKDARRRGEDLGTKLKLLSPQNQIREKRTYLMNLEDKLSESINKTVRAKRHTLDLYINTLKGLSPLDKLNQGYLVGVTTEGKRIKSVNDVQKDEKISLYVSDGQIEATVEKGVLYE